jgi:hypothetical protein
LNASELGVLADKEEFRLLPHGKGNDQYTATVCGKSSYDHELRKHSNSAVQNFNGACAAAVARMTRRGGVLALVRERCMLNKRPNPGTTIPNKTSRRAIKNHD